MLYNAKQIAEGKLIPEMVDYFVTNGIKTFQKANNLVVDGKAGPVTIAKYLELKHTADTMGTSMSNPALPLIRRGIGYYPTGKGIYIRDLSTGGKPEELVKLCKDLGFKFVVIGSVWQDRTLGIKHTKRFNTKEELETYGNAFRNAGIEVWVWGYPYPKREEEFINFLIADALFAGAVGVILDPEIPYRKKALQATVLMQMLKSELDNFHLALGVTSYGSVKYFKDFPYEEFARFPGTFGSPQVYDKDNNLPSTHALESFNGYKAAGFKEIVMSGPTFNKTPFQLKKLLFTYPTGTRGVIFWDLANLKANKKLYIVIKDYNL